MIPAARISMFLAGVLVLAACAPSRPDLERLYAASRDADNQPPVILIPGLLGSKLRDAKTGEEVWPGGFWKLLLSDYEELALPIDPETLNPLDDQLEAYAITDEAAGRDFYGKIIATLEGPGGYLKSTPGEPANGIQRRYYVFVYDWRLDISRNARRLRAFIEQIHADHGNPDLKVDLIAHSMGGLLARYYIRYGGRDVLDDNEFPVNNYGGKRIRRAILLGTPNLGSVRTVQVFIEGEKFGINRIPPEIIVTMPGAYQLLPHSLNNWLVTLDGAPLERDIFSAYIWRRFQWSIYEPAVRARIISRFPNREKGEEYWQVLDRYFQKNLERARRFVWSLTVPLPEVRVQYIVFGGDCHLTPARILVEEVQGESVIRLWPDEIREPLPEVDYDRLLLEPGDGEVTKASLLARESLNPHEARHPYIFFPLDYPFFLCEPHNTLSSNVHFRDNLLHALLSRD